MEDLNLNILAEREEALKKIERLVCDRGMSYLDATIYYCEQNNADVELVASYIKNSSKIKSYIQSEGEDLRLLARSARLPIDDTI